MSITAAELLLYGAATRADDDTVVNIGGGIAKAVKYDFTDLGDAVLCVSENGGDTSQTIQMFYRDTAGNYLNETKTLNGQSVVNYAAVPERLEKGVKSSTCAGNVALLQQTPFYSSGAAYIAGRSADTVTLDAAASAVSQLYRGMVIRITAGTGAHQLRQIVDYQGDTKIATLNAVWGTQPSTNDSTYTIGKGFFFAKTPNEITEIRRAFINAIADPAGGSQKTYFEKMFYWNDNASLDLTTSTIILASNPSGNVSIGVEGGLDGTTTNGPGNNRQVAPGGISFGTDPCPVANGQSLTRGTAQPVWCRLTLAAGSPALKSSFSLQCQGASI